MTLDLAIDGQPIQSNNKPWCARCGLPIVDANRTDWEVFVKDEDGKIFTQPICIFCQAKEGAGGKKASET
jgi:hypothetical protein